MSPESHTLLATVHLVLARAVVVSSTDKDRTTVVQTVGCCFRCKEVCCWRPVAEGHQKGARKDAEYTNHHSIRKYSGTQTCALDDCGYRCLLQLVGKFLHGFPDCPLKCVSDCLPLQTARPRRIPPQNRPPWIGGEGIAQRIQIWGSRPASTSHEQIICYKWYILVGFWVGPGGIRGTVAALPISEHVLHEIVYITQYP